MLTTCRGSRVLPVRGPQDGGEYHGAIPQIGDDSDSETGCTLQHLRWDLRLEGMVAVAMRPDVSQVHGRCARIASHDRAAHRQLHSYICRSDRTEVQARSNDRAVARV